MYLIYYTSMHVVPRFLDSRGMLLINPLITSSIFEPGSTSKASDSSQVPSLNLRLVTRPMSVTYLHYT